MKKLAFVILAAGALALAGCGGDGDSDRAGTKQSTVASAEVPFDRAFIDAMVSHHETAIELAREAKEAGLNDPELVKIANNILTTQQAEIDQMLEWRERWFGSSEREPEVAALEVLGLSPAEAGMEHSTADVATADNVDQAFAGSMIGHHTGAIRMADLAREKADHDELKELAGDIISAQQREIDIIQAYFQGAHG